MDHCCLGSSCFEWTSNLLKVDWQERTVELLRMLEDDVLNGVSGVYEAIKGCKGQRCKLGMRNLEIIVEVKHHLARIERSLKVYVNAKKAK